MATKTVTLSDGREVTLDTRGLRLRDALAANSGDVEQVLGLIGRMLSLSTDQVQDLPLEDAMVVMDGIRELVVVLPKVTKNGSSARSSGKTGRARK